jgi:hypothetical protein
MLGLNEILDLIVSNPAQAIAAIEALLTAGKLTKPQLDLLAKKFRDAQQLRKFGITPTQDLAKSLKKIDNSTTFRQLKKLIGKHPTLRLIRVGLYLEQLNLQGSAELVESIRNEIMEHHGQEGLKIINLGSAGILSDIIDALEDLKKANNLTPIEIIDKYEYLLKRFEDVSLFINKTELPENIEIRIRRMMETTRPQMFFVIAAGSAAVHTQNVLARMITHNRIRERGYMVFQPRVLQFGDKKQYLWTFYNFVI